MGKLTYGATGLSYECNKVQMRPDGTPRCQRCGERVFHSEQRRLAGKCWHKRCFACLRCKKSLDSTNCNSHDDEVFCNTCHRREFGPKGYGFANGAAGLSSDAVRDVRKPAAGGKVSATTGGGVERVPVTNAPSVHAIPALNGECVKVSSSMNGVSVTDETIVAPPINRDGMNTAPARNGVSMVETAPAMNGANFNTTIALKKTYLNTAPAMNGVSMVETAPTMNGANFNTTIALNKTYLNTAPAMNGVSMVETAPAMNGANFSTTIALNKTYLSTAPAMNGVSMVEMAPAMNTSAVLNGTYLNRAPATNGTYLTAAPAKNEAVPNRTASLTRTDVDAATAVREVTMVDGTKTSGVANGGTPSNAAPAPKGTYWDTGPTMKVVGSTNNAPVHMTEVDASVIVGTSHRVVARPPPSTQRPLVEACCGRCDKRVYFTEQVKFLGRSWHKRCFTCGVCRASLDSVPCSAHGSQLYCQGCAARRFGPTGCTSAPPRQTGAALANRTAPTGLRRENSTNGEEWTESVFI